jgi:endonuclease YncB( thermonuclease family)
MKRLILLGILSVAFIGLSLAQNLQSEFIGKVVTVIDGNTLEVFSNDNQTVLILLAGIDSPELTQDYGDKAKKMLEKLSLNKQAVVRFTGKDRKGQNIGEVLIDGKLDLRVELLREGLAWTAERNPISELEEYRVKAQEKNRGLWKQEDPTPPWIYRRQQTMMQAKSN